MFDFHINLTLKLHFEIANFKFSLEQIARVDAYHSTKWISRSQCNIERLVQKLCQFDIETTLKKLREKLIDNSLLLKVDSTWSYPRQVACHPFHVNFPFIFYEISTDSRQSISMSYRQRIDEDVSIERQNNFIPSTLVAKFRKKLRTEKKNLVF